MMLQSGIGPQGPRLMLLLTCCLLMLSQVAGAAAMPQLWLLGGSFTPCPEMHGAQCQREGIDDPRQVALTPAAIEAAVAAELWPEQRQNMRVLTHILLRRVAERVGSDSMPLPQLWETLAGTYISRSGADLSEAVARHGIERYENLGGNDPVVMRGGDFLAAMLPLERHLLADHLAQTPAAAAAPAGTPTPVEHDLLRDFVAALRGRGDAPPRVLIISAARDNPYAPVAALSSALRRLGVAAEWLPLDAVVALALEHDNCDELAQVRAHQVGRYQLHQHHPQLAMAQEQACRRPQLLEQALAAAQGAIILDGSMALLQSSFFTTAGVPWPWTKVLIRRYRAGALKIAAAGAAAQFAVGHKDEQAVPVMQAEHAAQAAQGAALFMNWCARHHCDDDVHQTSGLGLFGLGAIDTYTAERGREYRLLRATAASGTGVGFGIDDGTALQIQWTAAGELELQAHGRGTVLFVDTRHAAYDADGEEWNLRQARLTRLVPGGVLRIMPMKDDYQLLWPRQHTGMPQELLPPSRLVAPFFLRSWAQWFVANELPYAEAQYHVRPYRALLRLQRPDNGFRFFVAANGFVGFSGLTIDLSFSRVR